MLIINKDGKYVKVEDRENQISWNLSKGKVDFLLYFFFNVINRKKLRKKV